MKAILIILFMAIAVFARPTITIQICKEKGYDCQIISLEDVKNIEKIMDGEVLRITFFNGNQLDITVRNKYYEIKKH